MRRFFRLLLMAMVLVTVGLMSALTAMRIAIHGRETTIPNFTKLSASEAERLAMNNGLQVAMEGQFYSADVPEGRIVSQMPPAGTRVRRGWRVRLAQSLGPQRVVIPDVTGQSSRAAELNVRQRGLELGTIAQIQLPETPAQQVVAQSPPPNAQGVLSPKVSVLMSAEPVPETYIMPNFVGRSLAEAVAQIEEARLKVHRVHTAQPLTAVPSPKDAPATTTVVVRQTPGAGQQVNASTSIELEVNR